MTPSGQTFGGWLRQQRRALDLTQEELAGQVGCSAITLRKLEAEERRPSKQIAERLAEVLRVPADGRADFLHFARGDPFAGPDAHKPADQPVPRPAPQHNLPLQLTSFIGREAAMADAMRLLATTRLLTLTGAGGSGKTRLALEMAVGLLDASGSADASPFPHGIALVELAPLADPLLLPQALAKSLGLKENPGLSITATLLEHLRSKQLLLVLDNCEHLIQACADLAETLLRACPRLTILATSREGLAITGERTYLVPSLSLPDASLPDSIESLNRSEAARLFVERACAVLPAFALTNDNALAVAEICRRLDGIPLAIELAAARVNVLSAKQIAARLNDRFGLLTSGSRTALPRHQTLQALMDWSFDLLSEPERAALQRLAVFAGGCTLAAAEAVCSGPGVESGAVLDLLVQLVAKSLVIAEREGDRDARYRMLETIRQYALARLANRGELNATRRRHAEYYMALAMAKGSASDQDPVWYDHTNPENDNLLAALSWSQSAEGSPDVGLSLVQMLGRGYWVRAGRVSEGRLWSNNALSLAQAAGNRQAQALMLWLTGLFAGLQADYGAAQAGFEASMKLAHELGNPTLSADALHRLGWVARERGDTATASVRLEQALAIFRQLANGFAIGQILNTLGELTIMQGDLPRATAVLDEALEVNRALGAEENIGWSFNHLGHLAQLQDDYPRAMSRHLESLAFFRAGGTRSIGVAWAYQGLGETALCQRDSALATTHLFAALDLYREMEDRAGVAWCLAGLAGVAALDEEPKRATRLWGAAEALRLSIGAREAPASHATHERLMAEARAQMGEAAFDAGWAEGQALTLEQALDEALATD